MAEPRAERGADPRAEPPTAVRAYAVVLGSRLRAQLQYRTSFTADVLTSMITTVTGFIEVLVVFSNVRVLGDLDLHAALLVYGLAISGFGLANCVAGNLDTIPAYIRTGTLETMLVRPQPVLAQILTSDVTLRRLGGGIVGASTLIFALAVNPVHWTPARLALIVVAPLTGGLIFGALFLAAGALQFWLVDAAEVTSAFVYGGSYAAQFSAAVFPLPLRLLVVFVVPVSFAGYLPAAAVLGLPGAQAAPGWLGWCVPVAALVTTLAALGLWRRGLRHYTGAGG